MQARHFLHPFMASLCALALAVASAGAGARELTAEEAVAKVQQETSGKVLSVQTLMQGKRKVYRIKVLTFDGQGRVVQVPAEQYRPHATGTRSRFPSRVFDRRGRSPAMSDFDIQGDDDARTAGGRRGAAARNARGTPQS